jgi:L-ascorbate metabolism protein UlaG (beta-lactamase superfamily)
MCSELTPAWLLEIGAAFTVTFDPIFGEQGSTSEEPLPPCIVSFVFMPQIRDPKRSWFNGVLLPGLG